MPETADPDVETDDIIPESPETDPRLEAFTQLEHATSELEAAFASLENLKVQQAELEKQLFQACQDEKTIIGDQTISEAQGVEKLLECRAKRDLRAER
jgi:hypothetical protein